MNETEMSAYNFWRYALRVLVRSLQNVGLQSSPIPQRRIHREV
jgi:hypothetical protein